MILQRSRDFTSARRSRSNSPWQIMNRRISDRVPQYCPSIMMFFTHFNAQNDDVRRSIDPSRRLFPRFRVLFKWSDSSETAAALRAFSCSGEQAESAVLLRLPHANVTCFALSCYPAWQEEHNLLKMRILLGSRRGRLKFHKTYACASAEGSGVESQIQAHVWIQAWWRGPEKSACFPTKGRWRSMQQFEL